VPVRLASAFKLDLERPEFHRVILSSTPAGFVAHSTGGQISSRLLSCIGVDALVELPSGSGTGQQVVPAGALVSALLIGPLSRGAGARADQFADALRPSLEAIPSQLRPPASSSPAASGPVVATSPQAGTPASAANILQVGLLIAGGTEAPAAAQATVEALLLTNHDTQRWELARQEVISTELKVESVVQTLCIEYTCSLILAVGLALPSLCSGHHKIKQISSLSSLLRETCIQHSPAAFLGDWGALLCTVSVGAGTGYTSIILSLPAEVEAARASLLTLLPILPQAVAQARGCY